MRRKVPWLGVAVVGILAALAAWFFYSGEFYYQRGRWAESDSDRLGAIRRYYGAVALGHERAGMAFDRVCPSPQVLPRRSLPARNWCLYVAWRGNEVAAYRIVGLQVLDGDDMPKDVPLGVALLEVAAGMGDASAREMIAIAYLGMEPEKGVRKNVERGLYWLNEGAKRGDRRALDLLYRIYRVGRDVPQDRIEYTKWLLLALAYGDRDLDGFIKQVYQYELTPAEITEAERRAKEWLERYPPGNVRPG
jgi:TPR repeat protein